MNKYKHIAQHDEKDCGAACLSMIANYYGLHMPIARYREIVKVDNDGASIYGICKAAEKINLKSDALEGTLNDLITGIHDGEIIFPFIARVINKYNYEHFIVVFGIKNDKFIIGDPACTRITKMSFAEFDACWQNQIINFVTTPEFKQDEIKSSGLKSFFKYILNQKKALSIIFIISLVISGINLLGTTIFQFVLDDVTVVTEKSEACAEDCDEDHEHIETSENKAEKSFYDNAMSFMGDIFGNLDTVCIAIICLYLFKCFISILRGYMLAMMSKRISIPLLNDFYNHMIRVKYSFFSNYKSGDLISRFQNANEIKDAVGSATLTIMLDSVMTVVFGVMLFLINKILFLITLVAMILYLIFVFLFKNPIKRANYDIMESDARVTSHLKETIAGMHVIRTNNAENYAGNKFFEFVKTREKKYVKSGVLGSVLNSSIDAISSIFTIILLWTGAYLCIEDVISVGALFTFYYMIDYFLNPIANLINLQPQLQSATVAAQRMADISDADEINTENNKALSDITSIEIKDAVFSYGYRDDVIDNVNMRFKKGQKTAIIGESGSGKTTVAKLLMNFYDLNSGKIVFNNINSKDISSGLLAEKVAYIPQDIELFSDSIINNIRLGNENITDEDIIKACKICQADEFIMKLPQDYKTVLEESGSNLSIGQKQRIAIARAIVRKPEVLIMDEATSNLDSITEACIQKIIDDLSKNMICIIIAHRLKTIKNCDYIYVMDNGKIAEQGTHDKLINKNGLYARYYNI